MCRRFYLKQKLPGAALSAVSAVLLSPSSSAAKGISLLQSGLIKAEKAAEALHHFSYQEWIFKQEGLPKMHAMLSPEEQQTFFLNVKDINWREYIHLFFYGIARFLLHEPSGVYALQYTLHFLSIHIYISIYVCIYMYYLCAAIYIYMYIYVYVYIHVYICEYVCMHIYV